MAEEKHYLTNGSETVPAPAEALEWSRSTQAKMVDLKFTDLLGSWQHMSLPLSAFDESAFDEGLGFDGSSIRGWQRISESDMLLVAEAADALAAGDSRGALAIAERIATVEGKPGALLWGVARRLREVHRAATLLEAGVSEQKVGEALSRQPWLAKKILARAKKADRATLERALCALAEAEIELRGGGKLALDEDTAFSLALTRAAA